jgi:hypothetical protein
VSFNAGLADLLPPEEEQGEALEEQTVTIEAEEGEGAQLKYTMAYYHLPSGKRVKSKEEAEKDKSNDWASGLTLR